MSNKFLVLAIPLLLTINGVVSAQSGYLKFEFNTDSAHLVLDNDVVGLVKIASGDSINLLVGTHIVELYTPFDKEYLSFPYIKQDTTITISHEFRTDNLTLRTVRNNFATADYLNANIIIITDENTNIIYEGNSVGFGFSSLNLPFGNHEIMIKNPDYGTSKIRITPNPARPLSVFLAYKKPDKLVSRTLSFLPGTSQMYKKQILKGSLLSVSTATLLIGSIKSSKNYNNELSEFNKLKQEYNQAFTEQEALRLGDLVTKKQKLVTKYDNRRRFFIGSLILVYAYNIYDAFASHPNGGYRTKQKPLEFYLSSKNSQLGVVNSGTFKINF